MKRILVLSIVVFIFSLDFVGSVPPTSGESAAAPGGLVGERVSVKLLRWSTAPGGARSRTGHASGPANLYASTGFVGSDGKVVDELCSNAIGSGGDRDRLREQSAHLWWVNFQVLDATTQRIELQIDWSRYDRTADGRSVRAAGDRRLVTLKEGETHMLDFLGRTAEADGASRCAVNVLYEIQAEIVEDPELADTRLRYGVWVVDEWPEGRHQVRELSAVGGQGEALELEFRPLRWPVARKMPDGSPAEVVGEFSASVKGRLRPDGSVDVYLGASRGLGVAPAGLPRRGGVSGGGTRLVNVRPGEPVQLVLPTPGGAHTEWVDRAGAAHGFVTGEARPDPDGVAVLEHGMRVEFEPFFAGHRMSFIVTADVEPAGGN